jgi:hypothetical protein
VLRLLQTQSSRSVTSTPSPDRALQAQRASLLATLERDLEGVGGQAQALGEWWKACPHICVHSTLCSTAVMSENLRLEGTGSWGTLFLIALGALVSVYLFGGMVRAIPVAGTLATRLIPPSRARLQLYNAKVRGSRGTAIIPHRQTWAEVPGLVWNGVQFSVAVVRGNRSEFTNSSRKKSDDDKRGSSSKNKDSKDKKDSKSRRKSEAVVAVDEVCSQTARAPVLSLLTAYLHCVQTKSKSSRRKSEPAIKSSPKSKSSKKSSKESKSSSKDSKSSSKRTKSSSSSRTSSKRSRTESSSGGAEDDLAQALLPDAERHLEEVKAREGEVHSSQQKIKVVISRE